MGDWQARKQEAAMADKRLKAIQRGGIEAIWILLSTGDVYYRAAAILLLQEYCKSLVASGRGEYASRLVQEIRDSDPYKSRHEGGKLRP